MKHVRNSDFGQLTVIETELLQIIPGTRTQEEVLRIREGAIREPEELKIKDFRLSNGCTSWYVIMYSECWGSYMMWVEQRFLFYLKWIQEILYILPNQNKLFSFHLFSPRSATWNLCKMKSFLKKELGVKELLGTSVFLSWHHICLPACRKGVADGEGNGRRLWTGSSWKQKWKFSKLHCRFLPEFWDMTAHWLVKDMPTLFSILAISICLNKCTEGKQGGRHGDGGCQKLGFVFAFFLELSKIEGLHGPGVFTHWSVFSRLSSSSSSILHYVQTFTWASLTDKHLFWLTHECLSSVLMKGARLNALDKNVLHALSFLQLQTDLVQTSKPCFRSNAQEPLCRRRSPYSLLMFFRASDYSGLNLTTGLIDFLNNSISQTCQFMAFRSLWHWQFLLLLQ